jgi:subtilisin family serine protease
VRRPPPAAPAIAATQRPDEIVLFLDLTQGNNVPFEIAQQYRLVRLQGETNGLLQMRVQRYRIPDQRTVAQVITAVQGDPRVQFVQPNFLYRQLQDGKASGKGVPGGGQSQLQYAPEKLRLGPAHALTTGQRALIAVIDTGIDPKHPEIKGAVERWFNAVTGKAFAPGEHGTAIAGIIAARGQLTGVAPSARMLGVRAFFSEGAGGPLATTFILLRAVDWSHRYKARVLNLSFAGPNDEAVRRVLAAASAKGAILVAAAGNRGAKAPPAYPAAYPFVIAISATDGGDKLYRDANHGDYVDVAAPGVDVLVPVPAGGYDFKSGTSFAAAHVSGVIALMLELRPDLTTEEVRQALRVSSIDLGPKGADNMFGAGRTDAFGAVQHIAGRTQARPEATAVKAVPPKQ